MIRTYIICLLIAVGFTAFAQEEAEVLTLTLQEAQDLAKQKSTDIAMSGLEIDRAKAQVVSAKAALLPQVNGKVSYTQYGNLPGTVFPNDQQAQLNSINRLIEQQFAAIGNPLPAPISVDPESIQSESVIQFGRKFNLNAEVMLTQTVFNGVFLIGLQGARQFIELQEIQKQVTVESVVDNVKRSYYQVLAAKENIAVLQNNINNIDKLKEETQALYEGGFAEAIDVDRLQLSLNNLNVRLEQAQRQVELTETLLKFQIGIDIYQPIELVGTMEDFMEDIDYDFPQKGDFNKRTEITLLNVSEAVNESRVKLNKFAYLPSVTAFATLGSAAQRDKFNFFKFNDQNKWLNQRYFGFEVNVPIWNSFKTKGDIQNAKVSLEVVKLRREQLFHGMDMQYESSKVSIITAKEDLDRAEDNIELAEKIYNVAKIKYKEGVGSSIEMTNAERDLYQAQAEKIRSIYNLLIAKADLDKVLGNF